MMREPSVCGPAMRKGVANDSGTAPAAPWPTVSLAWRPYRTWAAVHLRALREQRTGEISGH
jgi:3-methyladenine DNA glycosylase/8-oxoguanine DNA glycosylase